MVVVGADNGDSYDDGGDIGYYRKVVVMKMAKCLF